MSRKPATPEDKGRPFFKSHPGQWLVRLEWSRDDKARVSALLTELAGEIRREHGDRRHKDEYLLLDLANRIRVAE